jgi:phage terminase Nu1 subunit (DNA packaging protein)
VENISVAVPEVRRANKAQAAAFFDMSLPTIEAWIRKGAPVVQRGGRGVSWELDLRAISEWYYGQRSGGGEADPDSLSATDRRAWYEGEAKKRDLQIRDRELILASEVEQVIATTFSAIAQGIRSIPDNLERRYGIAGEVAEKVEVALFEELDILADRLASLGPIE